MSTVELLEHLLKTSKYECEDIHRKLIMSMNGKFSYFLSKIYLIFNLMLSNYIFSSTLCRLIFISINLILLLDLCHFLDCL